MSSQRLTFFLILSVSCSLTGQQYIEANPFNLMFQEKAYFSKGEDHGSLVFRPLFKPRHNPGSNWTVILRSELFNNKGAPNLENTSDRWIGKGESLFTSLNISYSGRFIAFSLEPFHFKNENLDYQEPVRKGIYTRLNDARPHTDAPYVSSGVREAQFYLHYNWIGLGVSNANMWWGPGIHSSLNMTNNVPGFKHLMIGTLRDKRIRNVSVNFRYIFSEMDKKNIGEPYYTAIVFASTFHTDPVLTVGFSRTYISGGNQKTDYITKKDAMLLPFEALFLALKQTDPDDPESAVDIWDETLAGYVSASFPSSGLKVFIEYGRDDHAWNGKDLRKQPDHSGASVIGLRKYGLFGNKNMIAGIEYLNLIKSRFWTKRVPGTWYSKNVYDYSSYDGRHWGAHSGPDSDDFTIYLGYIGDKFSIIPAFNYERHGVIDNTAMVLERRPFLVHDPETGGYIPVIREELREKQVNIFPEVKFEFRLDIRYMFKNFRFNFYFEREFVDNLEFQGRERRGSVIWLGVERRFNFRF